MKIILFDADGVLTLPEEVFSTYYARMNGLDEQKFVDFFKNKWPEIVTGKKDLKDSIQENNDVWNYDGDIEDLLKYWFEFEDVRNEELLDLIKLLKEKDYKCYLSTDQEKYRGKYMKNVMFKNTFEGYFISSEIGYTKKDTRFFEFIIEKLKREFPNLKNFDIIFFDDSQHKIDTALSLGIDARLFKSVDQVKSLLNLGS